MTVIDYMKKEVDQLSTSFCVFLKNI